MEYYDIHSFKIEVNGPVLGLFRQEYGWARVQKEPDNTDLSVKQYHGSKNLPTKPAGCRQGMLIPFGEERNTLWYKPHVPLNVVLSFAEALLWWPDKTLLHAGGVVRDGKAYVFTGTGNVGKTSAVLNLLGKGYEYLSDDWLVVGSQRAYPLPKTLHVFDYNLRDKEIANAVLGWRAPIYRLLFGLLNIARKYGPHRYIRYAAEAAKPVFNVDITTICQSARVAAPSLIQGVYFLERKRVDKIEIHDGLSADELAHRMAYISLYEWHFFVREYFKYVGRFGLHDSRVENKLDHDYRIMKSLFGNVPLYRVTIPVGMNLTQNGVGRILEENT